MTTKKSRYVTGEIYAQIIKAKNDMTEKLQNDSFSGIGMTPHRIINESGTSFIVPTRAYPCLDMTLHEELNI